MDRIRRVEITEALKIDFAIFIIQGMLIQECPGQKNFWTSNFFVTQEMTEIADIFGERFYVHQNNLSH